VYIEYIACWEMRNTRQLSAEDDMIINDANSYRDLEPVTLLTLGQEMRPPFPKKLCTILRQTYYYYYYS